MSDETNETTLHETGEDATISKDGNTDEGAGQASPEDTQNGWSRIADNQQAMIDKLIEQNKSLQDQIVKLIGDGAQINDGAGFQQQQQQQQQENDDYILFKELGKLIGKQED